MTTGHLSAFSYLFASDFQLLHEHGDAATSSCFGKTKLGGNAMRSVYAKVRPVLYLRQGVLWCRRILEGHHIQGSTTKRGRHLTPATQSERETKRDVGDHTSAFIRFR